MKHLIELPNGDLIAGELLMGVNYFSGSGIALKGPEGSSLGFLKTVDDTEGLHWRDQLSNIIKGIHAKQPYKYDFSLPKVGSAEGALEGSNDKKRVA